LLSLLLFASNASGQKLKLDVNYIWFYDLNDSPKKWSKVFKQPKGLHYQWSANGNVTTGISSRLDTLINARFDAKELAKYPKSILGHRFVGAYYSKDYPNNVSLVIYTNDKGGALLSYENLGKNLIHYLSRDNYNPFLQKGVGFDKGIKVKK